LEEICTQIASMSHLQVGTIFDTIIALPHNTIVPTWPQTQNWQDDSLSVLTGRLNEMLAYLEEVPGMDSPTGIDPVPSTVMSTSGTTLPQGWRRVDASNGWKPSPIGVFVPCV
jgi:ribosomal biogenesis protein LAS1